MSEAEDHKRALAIIAEHERPLRDEIAELRAEAGEYRQELARLLGVGVSQIEPKLLGSPARTAVEEWKRKFDALNECHARTATNGAKAVLKANAETTFHVPGKAVGKSMRTNPRTMRRYKTKETKAWMRLISDLAHIHAPPQPWDGPVELVIEVTRRPLKTSKVKVAAMLDGRIMPTTKPDNDNYCKGVADALSGIVYVDDAQIVRTVIEKKYGAVEGTQITVSRWALGGMDQ